MDKRFMTDAELANPIADRLVLRGVAWREAA